MAKYRILIDESGTFDVNNEKYIVFAGVYFDFEHQEELEKEFVPIHKLLCDVFKCDELHGVKNKKFFDYLCASIGANSNINTFVFVVDKNKSYIFDTYDKISFKYNKAIEWIVKKLVEKEEFNPNEDELYIRIDNINLNDEEKINLYEHVPSIMPYVKRVYDGDSRNYICLQFADVISNHFSKKSKCNINAPEIKLLNPKFIYFLDSTEEDYVISG